MFCAPHPKWGTVTALFNLTINVCWIYHCVNYVLELWSRVDKIQSPSSETSQEFGAPLLYLVKYWMDFIMRSDLLFNHSKIPLSYNFLWSFNTLKTRSWHWYGRATVSFIQIKMKPFSRCLERFRKALVAGHMSFS